MTETLPKLPGAAGLYAKAATTATRKPGKGAKIPHLDVTVAGVGVAPSRLAKYRAICGFAPSDSLPITLPQVIAAPLHMHLMLKPEFPIPLMGIVHIRNVFDVLAPMAPDGTWSVRAALTDGRRTHQGLEFDILTEFTDASETVVFRSLMTPLFRMKAEGPGAPKGKAKAPDTGLAEYKTFNVPSDIGRRYAPIGGDFNPIHLSAITAKAFGFPRAIAHGMWSVARVAALLEEAKGSPSTHLEVQFRQPLLLPGKVSLKYRQPAAQDVQVPREAQGRAGAAADDGTTEFALLSRTSDKLHLAGSIR